MSIGDRIREARKEKGWSQAQLGKELGVKQQMIAQYENKKRNPNADTISKIAELLEVSSTWLRYGDSIVTTKKPVNQKYVDLFCGVIDWEKMIEESMLAVMKTQGEDTENAMKNIDTSAAALVKNLGENAATMIKDILEPYSKLNDKGKQKAVEYTHDLAQIDEYTKE